LAYNNFFIALHDNGKKFKMQYCTYKYHNAIVKEAMMNQSVIRKVEYSMKENTVTKLAWSKPSTGEIRNKDIRLSRITVIYIYIRQAMQLLHNNQKIIEIPNVIYRK
jgi:hypothetical protein